MDSDFFNRNLKKYATDAPRSDKYKSIKYRSYEEVGKDGPYDIIVVGSSVGNTGWVEMLRSDFGLKICNLTYGREVGKNGFIKAINAHDKINGDRPAILLYVQLTERNGYRLPHPLYNIQDYHEEEKKEPFKMKIPTVKLSNYIRQKRKAKNVKILEIGGREELFYVPDLAGLKMEIQYTSDEYSKISQRCKYYQEIAAEKNWTFAFIAFPTKPQQYEWLLAGDHEAYAGSARTNLRTLESIFKENNVPFLNLEDKLDPIAKEIYSETGKLLWARADTHMLDFGSKYVAEIVKVFIDEIKADARGRF
jgi:hypothetical protein